MSTASEIYKVALEQLAETGNEQAKLALAMAAKFPSSSNESAMCDLQNAQNALQRALATNSDEWSTSTDRRIGEAQALITSAIIKIK